MTKDAFPERIVAVGNVGHDLFLFYKGQIIGETVGGAFIFADISGKTSAFPQAAVHYNEQAQELCLPARIPIKKSELTREELAKIANKAYEERSVPPELARAHRAFNI